jgi:SAM-dependent methyltransferase
VEKLIAEVNIEQEQWYHIGFCEVCRSAQKFMIDWRFSDGINPNYRERVVCQNCRLNNRQRFMMKLLSDQIDKGLERQVIYCYEQVTDFYKTIIKKHQSHTIIGSEYLGFDHKPGEIRNGIRHEDALHLSFSDESLDFIVSNDVYEHVPDIEQALSEAFRVLKEKGKLLISIPFYSGRIESVKRVELIDGKPIYLLPEQYHGNPLSPNGSLVFYDYGWDFLDRCNGAGFSSAYVVGYHSLLFGYLGGLQLIFCIEK